MRAQETAKARPTQTQPNNLRDWRVQKKSNQRYEWILRHASDCPPSENKFESDREGHFHVGLVPLGAAHKNEHINMRFFENVFITSYSPHQEQKHTEADLSFYAYRYFIMQNNKVKSTIKNVAGL